MAIIIALGETDSAQSDSRLNVFSKKILATKQHVFEKEMYGYYYCSRRDTQSVFVLESVEKLSPTDEKLLKLFVNNLVITIENLSRSKQV